MHIYWPIRICGTYGPNCVIWIPHLHENGSIRKQGAGTLFYISPPCLYLSIALPLFPRCANWSLTPKLQHLNYFTTELFYWIKSPVLHPKLSWHWIGSSDLWVIKDREKQQRYKIESLLHAPCILSPALQESYSWPWPHWTLTTWVLPTCCQSSFSCFSCLHLYFPHILAYFHFVIRNGYLTGEAK